MGTAGTSCTIAVRIVPGSSREGVDGERGGAVLIRVNAPPLDGRANAALAKLISKRCRVPSGAVAIVAGERSRDKRVRIEGRSEGEVREALGLG